MALSPVFVTPFVKPSVLNDQKNGRLGVCCLEPVVFPGQGQAALLPSVAEAWKGLSLTVLAETGAVLTVTSVLDAYRSYDAQVRAWEQRMSPTYNPITCTLTTRTWNGVKYWLKRRCAPVAVPGTSNHGWACAIDVALWRDNRVLGITNDERVWNCLVANAARFGFSWEWSAGPTLPGGREPWHIRYVAGDVTPQGVVDMRAWFASLNAS